MKNLRFASTPLSNIGLNNPINDQKTAMILKNIEEPRIEFQNSIDLKEAFFKNTVEIFNKSI